MSLSARSVDRTREEKFVYSRHRFDSVQDMRELSKILAQKIFDNCMVLPYMLMKYFGPGKDLRVKQKIMHEMIVTNLQSLVC